MDDLGLSGRILSVQDLYGTANQRIYGDYEALLKKGSINEDYFPGQANTFTHFHDAVTNKGAPLPIFPPSAMDRAIGNDPLYGWDWINAREYFRLGLTSPTRADREENLGRTFYSLGRIAHLLQDMSVPSHVRNDLHLPVNWPRVNFVEKDLYELFWQNNPTIPTTQEAPLSFPLLTDFWDGDLTHVDYLNPDPGNGLAEFTNRHFLSQDTNFDDVTPFHYPSRWEPACTSYTMVEAPQGKAISVDYYRCTFNDHTDNKSFTIQHMTAFSVFDFELSRKTLFGQRVFSLNSRCFEDYGNVLIPKAIRYTAGLFDYFFRGSFEAPAGQSFVETLSPDRISLHLKNASAEAMTNGTLYLYQDDGDEAVVGTENRLRDNPNTASVASWPAGQVYQGSEFQNVLVWLPVGKKIEDITFTLVYVGQLGNEQGAVVARRSKAPAWVPPVMPSLVRSHSSRLVVRGYMVPFIRNERLSKPLAEGQALGCSCHYVHGSPYPTLLADDMTNLELCKDCHGSSPVGNHSPAPAWAPPRILVSPDAVPPELMPAADVTTFNPKPGDTVSGLVQFLPAVLDATHQTQSPMKYRMEVWDGGGTRILDSVPEGPFDDLVSGWRWATALWFLRNWDYAERLVWNSAAVPNGTYLFRFYPMSNPDYFNNPLRVGLPAEFFLSVQNSPGM